ncbi:sugar 3,4-ketoisomerase [Shewanella marina]|uniref:sugar 3,4-ketoisomerase n=1 Tax=Shewanella marina TaxID=487319 RepID=UPI0004715FFE|nr:FdtA/QdtA family cupin domain-containing protein [Shewanella marina]
MSLIKTVDLQVLGDERGSLVSIESYKNISFEIKRVYYLFDTKSSVSRGFHAHKELKQLVVVVRGSCKFIVDDGLSQESIVLNDPSKGLLIESFLWREMHDFSDDCVIMVLASEHYDENDYIRNYDDFIKYVGSL